MYTFFVRAQSVVSFFLFYRQPDWQCLFSCTNILWGTIEENISQVSVFLLLGPDHQNLTLTLYPSIYLYPSSSHPSILPTLFFGKKYMKKSHTHSHPVKLGCCCSAHFSSVFPVVPLSPPPPPYLNFQFRYHCFQTNLFFLLLPFLSCFLHCGKTHLFFRVKRMEKAKKMYTYVHIYLCTTCYLIGMLYAYSLTKTQTRKFPFFA